MRRIQLIIESPTAPSTNALWLYKGTAKYFSNGKWVSLGESGDVNWDDIKGKPEFATVATSGNYSDLKGTPEVVSASANGLMSVALYQKLNGIEAQANKYVLPAAGAAIGGVKIASAVADTDATEAATAQTVATTLNELLAALRASGVLTV